MPYLQVIGEGKTFSVYIWIHLKPGVNVSECAKVAASLPQKVKQVSPTSDADDAVLAGVGFGPAFYKQVSDTRTHTHTLYSLRSTKPPEDCNRWYNNWGCDCLITEGVTV